MKTNDAKQKFKRELSKEVSNLNSYLLTCSIIAVFQMLFFVPTCIFHIANSLSLFGFLNKLAPGSPILDLILISPYPFVLGYGLQAARLRKQNSIQRYLLLTAFFAIAQFTTVVFYVFCKMHFSTIEEAGFYGPYTFFICMLLQTYGITCGAAAFLSMYWLYDYLAKHRLFPSIKP